MSKKYNLSVLTEIADLRTVWPNEAKDFTPWLYEEGFERLSEAIGIDIEPEETESPVGNYSLDIFAKEADTDRKIVIENQLEETNHTHLGQIITYASGKDADIIIWVVKKARDEHKSAVEWLNNNTNENIGFFLVEVKLYKIGDSDPAPKFEVIEKPNEWTKAQKQQMTKAEEFRFDYWTKFNDYSDNNSAFRKEFNKYKASKDHWMSFNIGTSLAHIAILLYSQKKKIAVEYYINDSKELFDKFYFQKENIEKDLGFSLEWNKLDNKKASRIIVYKNVNFDDENEWESQMDWAMDTLIKFKQVFSKYDN